MNIVYGSYDAASSILLQFMATSCFPIPTPSNWISIDSKFCALIASLDSSEVIGLKYYPHV